jgi:hypothetical protein
MTNRRCQGIILTPLTLIFSLNFTSPLWAANLVIATNATSTTEIVSLQIDQVEKLAGMKLIIDYPNASLTYKSAQKASVFNSFMQVINDKKPGRLILVMASATGISGDNLEISQLTFARNSSDSPSAQHLKLIECQLMSESLHEIPCRSAGESSSVSQ